jgi:hypothetical protein
MLDKTSAEKLNDYLWFANERTISIEMDENLILIKSAANEILIQ